MLEFLNHWCLFSISFGLMLAVTFIMMWQSRNFYTQDVILRKFSMMDLELPATPAELVHIIKGLYISEPRLEKSIAALRAQLITDFIFMPLAYGSIFLICWRVSIKMYPSVVGYYVFMVFAFLQVIPWICDIIENTYLLNKIKEGSEVKELSTKAHKAYLRMEALKWGVALSATICAISAICYFWLIGSYSLNSLKYLVIIIAEITAFTFIANKFLKPAKK